MRDSKRFCQLRANVFRASWAAIFLIVWTTVLSGSCGCNGSSAETGRYPIVSATVALPDLTLTDQYGHPLSLGNLKGRPALFDFIYTSCNGPCQMLTEHLRLIADRLGPALGSRVMLISITVDPEHDRPGVLFDYARAFEANRRGWYFLTGSPAQIDRLMSAFRLTRTHESDGEIDHVLGYFLVGPDGHPIIEYSQRIQPTIAARDAEVAAAGYTMIGKLSAYLMREI